jgi:hypothetical protein
MINIKLKIKIVERFEFQTRFARKISFSDSVVSLVVRGRYVLSNKEKLIWANALMCNVEDIFSSSATC